jgi:hypothetical protein
MDLSIANLWTNYFSKLHCRRDKDGPLISLCTFENNYRNATNCREYSGAIIDFDNQREAVGDDGKKIKIPVENPDTPDIALNELAGTLFFYHSTFSTARGCPKWRLIVPFAEPVPAAEYFFAYDDLLERLGNPAGVDKTGREIARAFYLPSCNLTNHRISFVRQEAGQLYRPEKKVAAPSECFGGVTFTNEYGEAVSPITVAEPSVIVRSGDTVGRNNMLRAQVSAAVGKGKPLELIVEEVLQYDRENHNPPLFEDPSENFVPGQPEIGAWRFVSNIAFSHARNSGQKVEVTLKPEPEEVLNLLKPHVEEAQKKKRKKEASLLHLVKTCPGLVGEIAEWITSTAPRPQPELALGAALALVGAVKGHRVQTETGLRTNLYLLGLAESGSGKEHPSRAIGQLMKEAGLESIIAGVPASDSGLLKALEVNRGRALLPWDEFGHALSSFTGYRSAPHEKKIVDTLLKLFSKANATYHGKEYGNHHGKMGRTDLNQPCLCIWGTTVPERLFEALTSSMVLDGFTPRFLVLEVTDPDVPLRRPTGGPPPENILEQLRAINSMVTNPNPRGDIDFDIRPAVVEMTDAARETFLEAEKEFERRKIAARGDRGIDSIWSRGAEHVAKVGLTVASGPVIQHRDMEWAARFVSACLSLAVSMTEERISDNEAERRLNRIHRVIIQAGSRGISATELARQTAWAIHDRKKLLEELEQSEKVVRMVFKGSTRHTVKYFDNFLQRVTELGIDQKDVISVP